MGRSSHQLKVLNPIVVSYSVPVVDDLIRGYRPADVVRHYQDVFADISVLPGLGMIWPLQEDVSLRSADTALPIGVAWSSPASFRSSHTFILPQISNSCSSTYTRGGWV